MFAWPAGWFSPLATILHLFLLKLLSSPSQIPVDSDAPGKPWHCCFCSQTSVHCSQAGNLGQHLFLLAPPIHLSGAGRLHVEPGLAKDNRVWSGSHREACSPHLSSSTLAGPQASPGHRLPPQAQRLPWGIRRFLRQLPAEVARSASQKGVAGGRETS